MFVDMRMFLTKPVSNESPEIGLAIGTVCTIVKNGPISIKLWANKVGEPIVLDPNF